MLIPQLSAIVRSTRTRFARSCLRWSEHQKKVFCESSIKVAITHSTVFLRAEAIEGYKLRPLRAVHFPYVTVDVIDARRKPIASEAVCATLKVGGGCSYSRDAVIVKGRLNYSELLCSRRRVIPRPHVTFGNMAEHPPRTPGVTHWAEWTEIAPWCFALNDLFRDPDFLSWQGHQLSMNSVTVHAAPSALLAVLGFFSRHLRAAFPNAKTGEGHFCNFPQEIQKGRGNHTVESVADDFNGPPRGI